MKKKNLLLLGMALLTSFGKMVPARAEQTITTEIRENASVVTGTVQETAEETGKAAQEKATEQIPGVAPVYRTTEQDPAVDTLRGKLKITIEPERDGWFREAAMLKVWLEKTSSGSKGTVIEKVEARIGANGTWTDITDAMKYEVKENGTVYVRVTDQYGNEYEKSRLITVFDTVAPTLNAAVHEGLLSVMTYDTESGVECVYINGYRYIPDSHGILNIRLEKFDATYRNFYIYAVDKAGNIGTVNTIANPYWTDPAAENDEDAENPADALPDQASAGTTGEASAEVTSVTDENGEDIAEQISAKQFYSIVTADGQKYYLVIDMTGAKRGEDAAFAGNGASGGQVYLLTSVSNQNLLNFVKNGEQTLPHNSVAAANGIDPYTMTPVRSDTATTEAVTEEPEKEENSQDGKNPWWYPAAGAGVFILFVLALLSVRKKGKKGDPGRSDDAMYEEETELSEDDE